MIGVQQSLFPSVQNIGRLPGFYLLVANPSPAVSRQISTFKNNLIPMLGRSFGLPSKPHITIAGFPLGTEQVGRFERRLAEICSSCTPFSVALNGFGTFSNSGTIYVQVAPEKQLSALYRNIAQMLRSALQVPAEVVPKNYHPHITVVRNLNRLDNDQVVYRKLWSAHEEAPFEAAFEVDKLILLRYQDDGKSTQRVREFSLGPQVDAHFATHYADPSFPHQRQHMASLG